MDYDSWLNSITTDYNVHVEEYPGVNQFESLKYAISAEGLEIYLSRDDRGHISLFNTNLYHFPRFNVAEGFKESDFRDATETFLKGDIRPKRSLLGRKFIELKYGNLIAYGKESR